MHETIFQELNFLWSSQATAIRRSENFENNYFFAIQSGITVYILFHMENVIWNQI